MGSSVSLDYCEKNGCRVPTSDLAPVPVAGPTHSSPAEYEMHCPSCRGWDEDRDEDYERAAMKFDGDGRDWR